MGEEIVFNGFMRDRDEQKKRLVLLALALSLLLHALGIALLYYLAPELSAPTQHKAEPSRQLKIVREKQEDTEHTPATPEEQEVEPPRFAKTSAETPEQAPKEPDYIGQRDTAISGDERAYKEQDESQDTPAMTGADRDELNTVEQDKQDGDLEFDGLKQQEKQEQPPAPLVSPTATAPTSSAPPPSPEPSEEPAPVQEPQEDPSANEQSHQRPTEEPIKTIQALEDSPDGDILIDDISFEPKDTAAPDATPEDTATPAPELPVQQLAPVPQAAAATQPIYDPMFTPSAQPGFRTEERKTQRAGRFIIGKNAALNVASTPLGRYQELIYRRIAYYWYAMVADNCGDIIPGSLTIRLLVNHKGQITSMELVSRSGASISQQSITFAAIRKASIPPMPSDVQQGIVGDKLDLLYTFYFD